MNFIHSAARGKKIWLSELQGSAAMTENIITPAVNAREQQRWLWQGITHGADTVLFWCWRDEVFGREAGGFGISGNDGFAEQRLAAMKETGGILAKHADLLGTVRLDQPEVGIYFSPQSYYLNWCQEGNADYTMNAVQNYARALSRAGIPYCLVEEEHLAEVEKLKVLFLPRVLVLDPPAEAVLKAFVERGGVLVTESECGAWDSTGVWRYPEERFLARLTGVKERGRRMLTRQSAPVYIQGRALQLGLSQWTTPLAGGTATALSPCEDHNFPASLLSRATVGRGVVYLGGSFFGNGAANAGRRHFESFLKDIVLEAGASLPVEVVHPSSHEHDYQITVGKAGGKRVVSIFAPEACPAAEIRFKAGLFQSSTVRNLMTDEPINLSAGGTSAVIPLGGARWGIAILVEG
jgi:hypothetical protein